VNDNNNILLITPPDKIFNQNYSILLIYPNDEIRQQATSILSNSEGMQNVYLYNFEEEDADVDWLLSVAKMSDIVILDYDNSNQHVKHLASYIISLPHTYWLTSNDKMLYNKLSPNRIYGLDVIENLIGAQLER
jgi:hypothetical protein